MNVYLHYITFLSVQRFHSVPQIRCSSHHLSVTTCFSEEVHLLIIIFCISFIFFVTSTVKVEMVLDFQGLTDFLMRFICGSVLMGKKVQKS